MKPVARLAGAAITLASLAAPVAHAGAPALLPTQTRVLASSAKTSIRCDGRPLAGRPGVATSTFTAPAEGFLTARLRGGPGSDWDLALVEPRNGRVLDGSLAFGADEMVQRWMLPGERLVLQACRRAGPAARVPLTLDFAVAARPIDTSPTSLVQIRLPGDPRADVARLNALGLDLGEDAFRGRVSALIHSPVDARALRSTGLPFRTLVPDVAAADRRTLAGDASPRARAAVRAAGGLPSGRTEYRHLADVEADLKKLTTSYPAIVRPVTLPKQSFQGRDIVGVEISADVNRADDQKPIAFIMGEHHAREWPSAELTTEFAIYLAREFGTDHVVTEFLKRSRVVVVPVINPDGYTASREAVDPADLSGDPAGAPSLAESVGAGGSLAYRRKNCDGFIPSGATPCELQVGIDPNRNYGFNWGGPGASTSPTSQSYRGPGPWSEPETQAVHEYSQTHDVTSLLTMHNFASLVLRPPGVRTGGLAPDEPALRALGDAMGSDTGYTSEYGYELYDTSGTTEDWNYGAAGTYGYTMELGPAAGDGGNFHIDYARGVVEQWDGPGSHAGRGVRSALLRIVETSFDPTQFSTIAGRAPAGRTLRLKKTFQTSTSPICNVAEPVDVSNDAYECVGTSPPILRDDRLEYTTKVPASGTFSWLVTPSTRPFVYKQGKSESWTLTCEDDKGTVYETRQVTIWRGERQDLDLPCGGTLTGASRARRIDRVAPVSRISAHTLRVSRRGLVVRGRATDTAPAGLKPRVAKVLVALALRVGGRCRFAAAGGGFGPSTACDRPAYLAARGASRWTFAYHHRLPRGRYLLRAQAVDAAGNAEGQTAGNLLRLTVH